MRSLFRLAFLARLVEERGAHMSELGRQLRVGAVAHGAKAPVCLVNRGAEVNILHGAQNLVF